MGLLMLPSLKDPKKQKICPFCVDHMNVRHQPLRLIEERPGAHTIVFPQNIDDNNEDHSSSCCSSDTESEGTTDDEEEEDHCMQSATENDSTSDDDTTDDNDMQHSSSSSSTTNSDHNSSTSSEDDYDEECSFDMNVNVVFNRRDGQVVIQPLREWIIDAPSDINAADFTRYLSDISQTNQLL